MASFYSVIRYLPNPVTDEAVNIGVVAFGDEGPYFRFVKNFARAKALGGRDVSFLADFVDDVQAGRVGALGDPSNWSQERLGHLLSKWHNSIQFTPPRTSTKPADLLAQDIARIFLRELPTVDKAATRGRAYAVKLARATVLKTLSRRWGERVARELVKVNHPIAGAASIHDFDVAVVNSSPYVAARALSFRVQDDHTLRSEVDAAAFALSDLNERNPKIETAMVIIPPQSGEHEAYRRAQLIAEKKKIAMYPTTQFERWVVDVIRQLPERAAAHARETLQ